MKTQSIKISEAHQSSTNPRHIDSASIKELIESIKENGILVPLIVRKNKRGYEVIAGSRRLLAAKQIGLTEIPVRIMELTDQKTLEIQIIENLQRQDLHPLEEAEGYRLFLEKTGCEISELAKRVGKSERYTHQRLKLTDLIDKAKEMFMKEKITIGHAILMARLQPEHQKKVIKECFQWGDEVDSVRETKEWIEREIMLELHSSPFKKDQCKGCSKRTGAALTLFPDIKKKDICTDPTCFEAKTQEHIEGLMEEAKKEKKKLAKVSTEYSYMGNLKGGILNRDRFRTVNPRDKDDICDSIKEAIIVKGDNRGQVIKICANEKCKKHFSRGSTFIETPVQKATKKRRLEKARKKVAAKWEEIDKTVKATKSPLKEKQIDILLESLMGRGWSSASRLVAKKLEIEPIIKKMYGSEYKDYEAAIRKHIKTLDLSGKCRALILIAQVSKEEYNLTARSY